MSTEQDTSINGKVEPRDKTYSDNMNCVAFLNAYAELGTLTSAGRAVGIGRKEHYYWLNTYPDYAEAFADAKQRFADWLEERSFELIRDLRPGQSPILLSQALIAHKPEKYRPNLVVTSDDTRETLRLIMGKPTRKELDIKKALPERVIEGEVTEVKDSDDGEQSL